MLTVIIPAYNEQDVIADCLRSLLAQKHTSAAEYRACENTNIEIIVSANGCTDRTVEICNSFKPLFSSLGFLYQVLETNHGSKNNALNIADRYAKYSARLYLDADVTCSPNLLHQATQQLDTEKPVYFSGTLSISAGKSFFSNAYGKIWTAMPYIRDAVTGIGCYGVNSAGRALWGEFPSIHSDDKYVRMQFADKQCVKLEAAYHWPIPQGLLTLVKVRTRWIRGNKELRSRFPHLLQKKSESKRLKTDKQSITTMLANPIHTLAFIMVYASAILLAEIGKDQPKIRWSRAR